MKKKKALKVLHQKIVQLVLVWETNMAAYSLFWANENSNHFGGREAMSKGSTVTSCVFPKLNSAGWPPIKGKGWRCWRRKTALFPPPTKKQRKLQWGTKILRHFHKMAPFMHSRHLYPLPFCSPTRFPRNLCRIFKNPQVFLLLQTTLIRGWGCYSL